MRQCRAARSPRRSATALATLPPARQIKLYNAGSFFDPAAIPPTMTKRSPEPCRGFERVIVEAHPAFLAGALSRAVSAVSRSDTAVGSKWPSGSETAHPEVLGV